MPNLHRLWKALELPPGLVRSGAEWRSLLAKDFTTLARYFRLRQELAGVVPCPVIPTCGCNHVVMAHDDDDIVAVCCCNPKHCKDVQIQREDVLVYEVDFAALGTDIAHALSCTPSIQLVPTVRKTRIIGLYALTTDIIPPVYLTLQHNAAQFQQTIEKIILSNPSPLIVCAPTEQWLTPDIAKLLRDKTVQFLPLEKILHWDKNEFQLVKSVDDLLADFRGRIAPECEQYVFVREGATWRVVFEGEAKSIPHSDGMAYISMLLANPYKSISATDLRGSTTTPLDDDESADSPSPQMTHPGIAVDALSDMQAISDYKKSIEAIDDEIEIARATSNEDKIRQLERSKTMLAGEISRTQGHHGKLRISGDSEKARKSVSNAINRAKHNTQKIHPRFWAHFELALHTGTKMIYRPERSIHWLVKF